jgi:hypothetical protein
MAAGILKEQNSPDLPKQIPHEWSVSMATPQRLQYFHISHWLGPSKRVTLQFSHGVRTSTMHSSPSTAVTTQFPQTSLHNKHIFLHPNTSEQATMHCLQEWINGPRDINLHTVPSLLLWSVDGWPLQYFSIHMNCHPEDGSNCKRPFTLAHMHNRNLRRGPLLNSTVFPIRIMRLGILRNWCINLSVICCAGFLGCSKTSSYTLKAVTNTYRLQRYLLSKM